ncbi:MAG: hypothetical protein HC798_00990 [Polaribacter sp.]|nr:hypothetical protein [Polaribacter sp.]
MGINTKSIVVNDVEMLLSTQRVLYISKFKALILSDVHIGKVAHFQKHGIPISSEILQNDLDRLQNAIAYFKPSKVFVVGDLFHAGFNADVQFFYDWLTNFKEIEFVLIKGNHDQKHLSKHLRIIDDFFELDNFVLIHEPPKNKEPNKILYFWSYSPRNVVKRQSQTTHYLTLFYAC